MCPIAGCDRESSWLRAEEEVQRVVDDPDSTAFFTLSLHVAMEEYIKWQRRHVDEESMRRCQAESAMECSECGSRGSVVCETCNHRVYCDKCHPVMWQHHRLTPLSLANHHSKIVQEKSERHEVKCRRCEAHPEEECTLYCCSEGCECLVCSRCVFSTKEHFQHDVIPLDEAVASVSKRLEVAQESWLRLIDIKMRNVSRSKLSWEEMSAGLEKLFDALEWRLRELRQSTMEDMRRRYVNAEKLLVEESVRVGEQLGRLHVCVDQCKQAMKSNSVGNSGLDLKYSPSDRVETIAHCDAVLRTLPHVELNEDKHSPITFPSVTKSALDRLLTVCRPYRLEASRVCGESITVRFHTAFASVGPMNENVVEMEYEEIADDILLAGGNRAGGCTQRVSGVVHDHKFTIRGLTPKKKYRIRIVDNPVVELICRTSRLTGTEIWDRFRVSGKDIDSNNEVVEAIKCYEELVKEGCDGAALAALGVCHQYGIRITKDITKAIEFYRAAAELNNDDGQFLLASCFQIGNGVEKSVSEAVRLYTLAAEQGHPNAQNNLGCCFERGEKADYSEAMKWYRLSAHQGDRFGQCNVGNYYLCGKGVDKDLFEAFRWYQLSADQGHSTALHHLGMCYEKGHGVIKNHDKAVLCYRDAARKGYNEAKDALKRLNIPCQ